VILQAAGPPLVFWFFRAFEARKRGDDEPLRQLEADALQAVAARAAGPAARCT